MATDEEIGQQAADNAHKKVEQICDKELQLSKLIEHLAKIAFKRKLDTTKLGAIDKGLKLYDAYPADRHELEFKGTPTFRVIYDDPLAPKEAEKEGKDDKK